MVLSLNDDATKYTVKMYGAKDGQIVERYGCAEWQGDNLVFYSPMTRYTMKTFCSVITHAEASFRGFLITFEFLDKMYCVCRIR